MTLYLATFVRAALLCLKLLAFPARVLLKLKVVLTTGRIPQVTRRFNVSASAAFGIVDVIRTAAATVGLAEVITGGWQEWGRRVARCLCPRGLATGSGV